MRPTVQNPAFWDWFAATRPITRSLRVAVVDGLPLGPGVADLIASSASPDPRVVAISPASVRLLKGTVHANNIQQFVVVRGYVNRYKPKSGKLI